jgi:2-polyprenyl-3-methyl-5-hydroxy-6-metoxy-1,4-benzoquinol methylase
MESIETCPVCNNNLFVPFLSCADFTVSRETFEIVSCTNCGFKLTNPRPDNLQIQRYYESSDYVSHSNTDKGLINKLYKFVRGITLKNKLGLINSLATGKRRLLDVGCGTGDFLKKCEKGGWETVGIEPNEKARSLAIENHAQNVHDESLLITSTAKYNVITLWHVLEHVHGLNDRINQLKGLLEPQGTLIIAVPNCGSYDAKKYERFWAAYDLPRHLYHFTPQTMQKLLLKHNLKIERMLPMPFDAYYVSMLSEKYKGHNIKLFSAFINGMLSNWFAKSNVEKCSSVIYIVKAL